MTEEHISILEKENDRLKLLATHDELTGLLNRRATEEVIRNTMMEGGALLVCDLDHFKSINDRFGHLVGDRCLQKSAELLGFIMRKNDVVGRVGGDEFVIFAYGVRTEETVAMLCKKIEKRFQAQRHEERILPGITVGGTLWQNDEDYTDMFERADQALLAAKERKRKNAKSSNTPDENWLKDMDQITEELAEQISMPGAFCQDFESFKSIYHFLERCMRRNNQKACLILMSLVELNGENILPHEKPEQMDALEEILRHTLRLGDVYTRYSCCQFLVLLMDTTGEQAERVALRVRESFQKRTSDKNILFLYCHELHSARLSSQNYPDSCDRLDL